MTIMKMVDGAPHPWRKALGRSIVRLRKRLGRDRDRDAGDAARTRNDWTEAAIAYRRHLGRVPRDSAIWVQLGHALKEAGRPDEARGAYLRALAIRPCDPEVLLSLGHLHKRLGDWPAAIAYYTRAAAQKPGGAAEWELAARESAPHLDDAARALLSARVPQVVHELAEACEGLRIAAVSGLSADPAGRTIVVTARDTWIEFEPLVAAEAPLGRLDIVSGACAGDGTRAMLYLDYPDHGPRDDHALALVEENGAPIETLILARPGGLRRLRWYPDLGPGVALAPMLRLAPIATLAEGVARLDALAPIGFDRAGGVRALAALFAAPTADGGAILAAQQALPGWEQGFAYRDWIARYAVPAAPDRARIAAAAACLPARPSFSILLPVFDPPPALLRACLDALLVQSWPHFELCIVDDASTDPRIVKLLGDYVARDDRVRVSRRDRNGHISAASNSALALAKGDYVVLVDHDDLVPDHCLYVIACAINAHPAADVLYSDEDKIDLSGNRSAPYFKGGLSRFLMYGHNMVSHLGVYRRSLVQRVGGFREGLEGSQDYDLFLRCYEQVGDAGVAHVPHILYHWRILAGSTALAAGEKDYAIVAARRALNEHFGRTGLPLRAIAGLDPGCSAVEVGKSDATVSVVVDAAHGRAGLRRCLESVLRAADRPHEVFVVVDPADAGVRAELAALDDDRLVVIEHAGHPNGSNLAARRATGALLCLIDGRAELTGDAALGRAAGLLEIAEVGMVGGRVAYADGRLRGFGQVLGAGRHGVAAAAHAGLPEDQPGYFGKARLLQDFSAVGPEWLMMRRMDFVAVGGLDPRLRAAFGVTDLCLRVADRGLRIVGDPAVALRWTTPPQCVSEAAVQQVAQDARYMHARWGKVLRHDRFYSPNLSLGRTDHALAFPPRVPPPWAAAP